MTIIFENRGVGLSFFIFRSFRLETCIKTYQLYEFILNLALCYCCIRNICLTDTRKQANPVHIWCKFERFRDNVYNSDDLFLCTSIENY